jgi:hypothetical protein
MAGRNPGLDPDDAGAGQQYQKKKKIKKKNQISNNIILNVN